MELLQPANLVAWAVQAAVVVVVAAPLPRLLGIWSPRARMAYWRAVLVGCLLLPALQPWGVRQETPPPPAPIAASVEVTGPAGSPAAVVAPPGMTNVVRAWLPPIGVAEVLAAGIVLRLAWLGLGIFTLGRLRRSARPLWPRPPSVDRAANLAETDAEFLVSATSSRPVTCGWVWPVVLVPRTFETFPEHEQTAIATHELLHVGRADWARNAADEVVRAVLWFHPGVWFVINQIQLAREQVVDREAVRRLGARQPYLQALLRLARPAPRLVLTPASLFLKRAHLRQRVTLLVKEVSMSRVRLFGSLAVMAVIIVIGGRLATAAFPLQQTGAKTPGVATPAPKLTPSTMGGINIENGSLRGAIAAFTAQTGIAVTTDVPDAVLDRPMTLKLAAGMPAEHVLRFLAQMIGGSYRISGERSVVLTGGSGMLTSAATSGMAASGVPGGVGGGIPGGAGGGVGGGVPGGVGGGAAMAAEAKPAAVVRRVDPNAPGLTGQAIVGLDINSDGTVGAATWQGPTSAASDTALAQAAIDAAKQWRFEPGQGDARSALIGFNLTPTNTGGASDAPLVRIGGDVPPPIKTRDVKPAYPEEARRSGLQGVQILEISVAPSGAVLEARALRSLPGLIQAAIDAVLRWEFTPWNGPERRLMTVTVNFALDAGVASRPSNWPADALRVGAGISPPTRVAYANPVYPQEARDARVQGVVILEILIGPDGTVKDAVVLRSIPLLDKAAEEAVRQWQFTPTLVNGNPVSLIMTVTVNFTLL